MKPIITFVCGLLLVMAFQIGYLFLARVFRNHMRLEKYEWAMWFWIMTLILLSTCNIFHSNDPRDIILWSPMALVAVLHVFVLATTDDDVFDVFRIKTPKTPPPGPSQIKHHGVRPREKWPISKPSSCRPCLSRHVRREKGDHSQPTS